MNKKLIELKEQAKEDLTFFYPEFNGVKGFSGTEDVFFISSKPSMGDFPPKSIKKAPMPARALIKFLGLLKKYGFANAHLTDIIKTRSDACNKINKLPKKEVELNLKILQDEIDLLKPKILVPVGSQVDTFLKHRKEIFKNVELWRGIERLNPKTKKEEWGTFIYHYSPAAAIKHKWREIKKDLQSIKEQLEEIKAKL